MSEKKTFIDFLYDKKIIDELNYCALQHYVDIEIKELLVDVGFLTKEKVKYLWGEYIRNEKEN